MANEKRLIDANEPIKKLEEHRNLFINAWQGFAYLAPSDKARVDEIDTCIADILNAPTIDAVPVVRCKDCKKWHEETGFCEEHSRFDSFGMDWNMFVEDDFCSYGERRTDERKAD